MGIKSEVLISVCMITYNQEKYVCQAIDSVLAQKTDYSFEVIVGDDASSDNTQRILSEYYGSDSRVKLILREENLRIKNDGITNFEDVKMHASGKYICYAEGDDYWTDDYYLQKMIAFLEENPKYAGVSGHRVLYSEKTGYISKGFYTDYEEKEITLDEYVRNPHILDGAATVYRNFYHDGQYEYRDYVFSREVGDLTLVTQLLLHGPVYQMKDVIGVYRTDRLKASGSYNTRFSEWNSYKNHIELILKMKELLGASIDYDSLLEYFSSRYLETVTKEEDLKQFEKYIYERQDLNFLSAYIEPKKKQVSDSDRIIELYEKNALDTEDKLKLAVFWLNNREKAVETINEKGWHKIGIYGARYFGDCLYKQLTDSNVEVVCMVDRNKNELVYEDVLVLSPDDVLPQMDALVVTAIISFDAIKKDMEKKVNIPIISLEELLY